MQAAALEACGICRLQDAMPAPRLPALCNHAPCILTREDSFPFKEGSPPRPLPGAILAERCVRWRYAMLDLLFVVLTVGFFAVAWAYVRGCERV